MPEQESHREQPSGGAQSDPEPRSGEQPPGEPQSSAPPPTPFDHPFFLPVILLGLTLWFGYDAYLNQDPEMLEHLAFNRFGFRLLLGATLWFGYRGWSELRDRPEHPLVLPGVLLGLAAWFAYAGWLSEDPFETEHALWNQYGCYGFLALAVLYGARGLWRLRQREAATAPSPEGKASGGA